MSKQTGQTVYTCDHCGVEAIDVTNWRSFSFHFGQTIHEMLYVNGEVREYCPDCIPIITTFLGRGQ